MQRRRIKAMAKKEIQHILRDPFTLAMALFVPVFLVTAFGFAIDLDIHDVQLAIIDQDRTQASRMLSQTFTNSSYFEEVAGEWPVNPEGALASESAKAALVIPKEFEENLVQGRTARVQILVDGTDNSVVGILMNYFGGVQKAATRKLVPFAPPDPVNIIPRYLFNPEQESPWFIVPGLSVVVLSILSILLTALTVAREWETGSMELLLSTPVRPSEIVVGKLFPYLVLGLVGAAFVYLAARLVFHIPFKGSYALFGLGTLLFLITYLALGLLISAIARRQQLAMQVALVAGYMPSLLLSGFIFSVQSMDPFWRALTACLPARWYMQISRACYLKDPTFMDLLPAYAALAVVGCLLIVAVTKKFTGSLER